MKNQRDDNTIIAIGRKCRKLRMDRNYTQEQVNDRTNIYVSRIENGYYDPSITTISRLCTFYEITLSEFFIDIDSYK